MGLGLKAVTETSLPCEQDLCAEHALWGLLMEEEATAGSATLKLCSSHSAGMGD